MEDRIERLEQRLGQIEHRLDRMTGLLEQLLDNKPAASVPAIRDPAVLDALVRVATLAPQLEYAAHALAAAPELLSEGVELAQSMAAHSDLDSDALQQRLFAGADMLTALSEPRRLVALKQLSALAPVLGPASEVLASRPAVPGQLADVLLQLSAPDTLQALSRIATTLPEIAYVVHGLSAAPELMGEAADTLRALQASGIDVDTRLRGGLAVLESISSPAALQAIVTISEVAAKVPVAPAHAEAGAQLLVRLSEPGTADTIGRLVDHAARLEPLLAGLAAQPRALEVLSEVGAAIDSAARYAQPIGAFGLLTVLREPEVRRALGAALTVTRHLGRTMAPNQLPAEAK